MSAERHDAMTAGPRPVTPAAILAQRLDELVQQLDNEPGVDAWLTDELRELSALAGGLDPYLTRCTTAESPALLLLALSTREQDWDERTAASPVGVLEPEMLSGHVEGQLLKMLVHLGHATQVLDIGMFTGYSALAMAEALPADGRVVACELDPDVAEIARHCFRRSPDGAKIDVRVGPAAATLNRLAADGATFDLIFLDADKAGYRRYLDAVLDGGLLAEHGVVCVDNTLMQGEPWTGGLMSANGAAIAEFNDAVAADPRVEQVVVPLRDGLTLIRRAGA